MKTAKQLLSHLNGQGKARMVDVGRKAVTRRHAVAFGEVRTGREVIKLIQNGGMPKGDVLAAARIAGIMAAKKVDEIIPLCHKLSLDQVEISFAMKDGGVVIRSRVKSSGKTGVEMEALTAVSVAALTVYDMCKSVSKEMEIGPIFLLEKTGGKSGTYRAKDGFQKLAKGMRWL